jgi:N-acyl-D-amino-acid deacylase
MREEGSKMAKYRNYLVLGILLLVCTVCMVPACGSKTKTEKIDELVERYKEFGDFNGCLLVVEDGKVIYEEVHGIANIETGESLTVEHRFRLASVSKQFTAMAIMVLKEQGTLSYDDEIKEFIPELPYENITIRHLLTHSSGLPAYTSLLDEYWDPEHKESEEREIASNDDALAFLIEYKPPVNFKPGEKHSYCNTGYNLLAVIVERVSGMTFQDFLKEHIFGPAGMDNSFVNDPSGILPEEKRARGFKPKPDRTGFVMSDFHYQNGMYGDGGIYATIEDMYRWEMALQTGKLVSGSTLEEVFSPSKLNDGTNVDYGFGWSIIDSDVGRVVAHGGGWLGFTAFIFGTLSTRMQLFSSVICRGFTRAHLLLPFSIYCMERNTNSPGGRLPKSSLSSFTTRIFSRWSSITES